MHFYFQGIPCPIPEMWELIRRAYSEANKSGKKVSVPKLMSAFSIVKVKK